MYLTAGRRKVLKNERQGLFCGRYTKLSTRILSYEEHVTPLDKPVSGALSRTSGASPELQHSQAEGSQVQSQPGTHSEILLQKNKWNNKINQ